jgi:hypothetical protein
MSNSFGFGGNDTSLIFQNAGSAGNADNEGNEVNEGVSPNPGPFISLYALPALLASFSLLNSVL